MLGSHGCGVDASARSVHQCCYNAASALVQGRIPALLGPVRNTAAPLVYPSAETENERPAQKKERQKEIKKKNALQKQRSVVQETKRKKSAREGKTLSGDVVNDEKQSEKWSVG